MRTSWFIKSTWLLGRVLSSFWLAFLSDFWFLLLLQEVSIMNILDIGVLVDGAKFWFLFFTASGFVLANFIFFAARWVDWASIVLKILNGFHIDLNFLFISEIIVLLLLYFFLFLLLFMVFEGLKVFQDWFGFFVLVELFQNVLINLRDKNLLL